MAKEILLVSLMTITYFKALPEYKVLSRNTWQKGFNDCKYIPNLTMSSAEDIEDRKEFDVDFASELKKHLPVWTYAFEITSKATGRILRIKSNDITDYNNSYTCYLIDGCSGTYCCKSFINAQKECKRMLGESSSNVTQQIHLQTLNYLGQPIFVNTTHLGTIQDEKEFLHGSTEWSVRCLLLDEKGNLRTDNCAEHHRTMCIQIPIQTTDTGTYVSIRVVIAVCISAVVLMILDVVMTILIVKKRKKPELNLRVGYVAEQANANTLTHNETGHTYATIEERQEHSNDSPITQMSAYESLGERNNDEYSYVKQTRERLEMVHGVGTPNTQINDYESLDESRKEKDIYQPLEEENVDTHNK